MDLVVAQLPADTTRLSCLWCPALQFKRYPTSIASLDFNHDGSLLAVASSYTYEEGEKE